MNKADFWAYFWSGVGLVAFIAVIAVFETKGLIGSLLFLLALFSVRLFMKRKSVMMALRYAETELFGKPLDRMYWKDGKKPKMKKIVWRKKNGSEKEEINT